MKKKWRELWFSRPRLGRGGRTVRNLLLTAALALMMGLLTSCRAKAAESTVFAMDTVMSVQVSGRRGPQAVAAAREAVERLDGLLSRTDSDSQIARLNTAAGDGAAVAVDPDVAELLAFSQEIARQLPGDFDITIAPVMDAWGFTREERHVPDPDTLADTLALVDWRALTVAEDDASARLEEPGMAVDLGAVAKGFAAQRAADAIRAAGGTSALLDLGGNITVLGSKPDGADWRVAVKDPQDTERQLGVVSLRDKTLSTSGGYERYFEANGITYHHILDPETGYPADSGLLSVTVVSSDPLLADALSTALFVAGRQAALDYWRSRDDFELILCGSDGVVTVTEGLTFAFRGEEHGYTCETARR